ncbi:S8 family peptidase [Nocardioides coralli]|uniref:S8 family peptidase n=1 Tax=Nocardioides coralli TaxID=2872154 RepID=UPI001CA3B3C7|nr:S8 family peptidase [Nocardioides coralli]QZY28263.1 S8 family serine peptidase [Nocardioides coralli]
MNLSSSPARRGRGLAVTAAAALTLGTLTATAGPAAASPDPDRKAPVLGEERSSAIDGRYIVVMEERASGAQEQQAADVARRNGGSDVARFQSALEGFSAKLPDRALQALRSNPNVAFIEADQRVSIATTQNNATWGLDRIDQRNLPLNGTYTYTPTGSGVTAYIIDTGVRASHAELTGRMASGYTAISDGRGTDDCNGHGTHVAGTVGGTTYGVAKQVTIRPVRVLDCNGSGSTSGVIAGVDWVTSNHAAGTPAVANMSLGGGVSTALDNAVNNSIADGVSYAVAAGNDNTNACNGSPSRVGAAITVGSTTSSDARSSFSNYGSCLDLFAPGSSITSAWHTSDSATNTISGTSMATPHVAGVAALYLQGNPTASPSTVASTITSTATSGVVTNAGSGSPNRLLYSLLTGGTPPPPPPTGNVLQNPGFESGATAWTATSGVITSSTGAPARTGSWKAWFNGYGTSNTDTLTQDVTVPSSGNATLSFHLYISSAETTAWTAYDTFRVQIVSGGSTTTLGTFSNLDEGTSYVERSFDVSAWAGDAVTVKFVGTEDSSLATSFVVDDTSLTG